VDDIMMQIDVVAGGPDPEAKAWIRAESQGKGDHLLLESWTEVECTQDANATLTRTTKNHIEKKRKTS
jgi:hypothetical protein